MNAEIYASPDGWRFRVRGGNGEIMATGESYVRRIDAEHALQVLFASGPLDVAVRNHGGDVERHYVLGPVVAATEPDPDQPELPFEEGDE